jgi:hypothetical protein
MSYVKVTLDGQTHELNPENLCLVRDQIVAQAGDIGIIEAIKLAAALKITIPQLMAFMSGLKSNGIR